MGYRPSVVLEKSIKKLLLQNKVTHFKKIHILSLAKNEERNCLPVSFLMHITLLNLCIPFSLAKTLEVILKISTHNPFCISQTFIH